jgi:ParB family transcriptional regulator, chromosome partitioning protein
MENQIEIQNLNLAAIRPNPLNSRKKFSGKDFDELKLSIEKKGVIQPILVRPVKKVKDIKYEIVFGERRFRASGALNKNGAGTIPAMVRKISDDDAFDLMTIENLQRKDLTGIEEAESFKVYVEKKGDGAVQELAERVGIDARYIRRRMAVLTLPKNILKAWEKGVLKYGHLEQFMRLKEKKDIQKAFKGLFRWKDGPPETVRELKRTIDNEAPYLQFAKFSLEKSGCLKCHQNSDIQKTLWGTDSPEKVKCLNRKCFKKHQAAHLLKNWKKGGHYKKFKTLGFMFREDLDHDQWNSFGYWDSKKPTKKCRECADFVTIIALNGDVSIEKACVGKQECYDTLEVKKAKTKPKQKTDGPRVPWHGTYFREKFYESELPLRIKDVPAQDLKISQLALYSFVQSNSELRSWFALLRNLLTEKEIESYYRISDTDIFDETAKMNIQEIELALKEASVIVAMSGMHSSANVRHKIAGHFGIELEKEFKITEEYLQKKTIAEMLEIGESLEIFADKKAQDFLFEKLLKKRGKFKSCKKGELIKVFMESGVDLTGKVPEEIINADQNNQ